MAGLEWIAALVGAALAGGLLFGFLGQSKAAPVALLLAIALHVVLPWWLPTSHDSWRSNSWYRT